MARANFLSMTSSFSGSGLEINYNSGNWFVSFDELDGEVKSSLVINGGLSKTLYLSSSVDSGTLTVKIQQNDKILEIPHGEQTINLEGFRDGAISISVKGINAVNGKVTCTV